MTKKSVTFDLPWRKAKDLVSGCALLFFVKAAAPCWVAQQGFLGELSLRDPVANW